MADFEAAFWLGKHLSQVLQGADVEPLNAFCVAVGLQPMQSDDTGAGRSTATQPGADAEAI